MRFSKMFVRGGYFFSFQQRLFFRVEQTNGGKQEENKQEESASLCSKSHKGTVCNKFCNGYAAFPCMS
jgi:hypothetical protein